MDFEQQVEHLNQVFAYFYAQAAYRDAIPYAGQAFDLAREHLGEGHPLYATCLNNLASLFQKLGNYDTAETHFREALDARRRILGHRHRLVAASLNNLAALYRLKGQYAAAEPLYLEALDIARATLEPMDPDIPPYLNNLGFLYKTMGRYAEAEQLLREALRINRAALGVEHPDVVPSLNNLAELYADLGDYAAAEPLYRQSLTIRESARGERHPSVATTLNNLGVLYKRTGNYAAAEPLFHRALDIDGATFGEHHVEYATDLKNLGDLYGSMGRLDEAQSLYDRAFEIFQEAWGADHPDVATTLSSIAGLRDAMGDYETAASLYRQVLEIRRARLSEQHPLVAGTLSNLAGVYRAQGNPGLAELLYLRALESMRAHSTGPHPYVATILNNLADLYRLTGDLPKAKEFAVRALDEARAVYGEDHPVVATILSNRALIQVALGDFVEAEEVYRRALEIRRRLLGEQHPSCAGNLNNLGCLYAATHRPIDAMPMLTEASAIFDRMIGQVFGLGSERQRMAYLATLRASFEGFLSLVLLHLSANPTAVRAGMDLVLRRKAIGLEVLAAQRTSVLSGKYPHLEQQLKELAMLRFQIANTTMAGPGVEEPEVYRRKLNEWATRRERLEEQLARQIPEMRLEPVFQTADRHRVVEELPEGAVLIEFVRIDIFDFTTVPGNGQSYWGPAHYLAFVLHAGDPDNVQTIDLGEADGIDQQIAAFRERIIGRRRIRAAQRDGERVIQDEPSAGSVLDFARRHAIIEASRDLGGEPEESGQELSLKDGLDLGRKLRATLFDPLLPALTGCIRLFLAPDGDLTRLPFEVLPTDDGHYLIDTYQISYLGVGRDVLRFKNTSTAQLSNPVVAADPNFDLAASSGTTGSFRRLTGTREEGREVAAMLGVQPLMQNEVVEKRIKDPRSPRDEMVGRRIKGFHSPRILHLATHGFFLPDQPHDPNEELLGTGMMVQDRGGEEGLGRLTGRRFENPLLRSGLALAGANTWLSNQEDHLPPEAEDGLLTAEDVAGMDLLDTELVVLSACETGLGEIHVGEGVFGLRRAFVVAGARTLVMSLWKVPDQATRELMEEFYRRLLQGEGRAEALRNAQLWMKERHPHPRDWGAFICQGDPGPLSVSQGN